jgi:hypothetical protein
VSRLSQIDYNDLAVITCDVLSTVCLGLLSVTSLAGVQLPTNPWEAIALFAIGKGASTVLSHLQPIGNRRVDQ